LVENSRSFKGFSVVDAYLEFVEPSENGRIEELHIDFNGQRIEQIKLLTLSVWEHVQSLDFPDTSNLKPNLTGIESLEGRLING
jgi:hypothetical protein